MRRLALPLVFLGLAGCVAYNEQCQALVDNPTEKVAILGKELFLDKPNARHAANALGQATADAFVDTFSDSGKPADFGIVNGGSFRAEGLCGITRNIVPAGPLTNGVLHEIMLFENLVGAVDVTEEEVMKIFEHSAQTLFQAPNPIISPAGSYLQLSKGVEAVFDCSQPVNSRVTSLKINGEVVQRPARINKRYRVATNTYLLGGGDGYTMLAGPNMDPDRNPSQAQRFGGIDSNLTTDYLRRTWNKDPGLTADPARISMPNCSAPGRPTN